MYLHMSGFVNVFTSNMNFIDNVEEFIAEFPDSSPNPICIFICLLGFCLQCFKVLTVNINCILMTEHVLLCWYVLVSFKICMFVFKCFPNLAPPELLHPYTSCWSLSCLVGVPRSGRKFRGDSAFSIVAPEFREVPSLSTIKTRLWLLTSVRLSVSCI